MDFGIDVKDSIVLSHEMYVSGYNQALDDFIKAIEKQQQENWIGNLEYGITFDDLETVKNELKK